MFRSEPAVSGFDGPFTPRRRSREGIVGHQRYRASTCLSARFTLPTPRSSGFGSCPFDSPRLNTAALVVRLRPYRFPSAFPDDRVRLVKQAHSLVRFSKRTTGHRLPDLPTALSRVGRFGQDLVCPVALSPTDFTPYCTSLLGVLFSVRSRYLFAIGLEECLVFAVDARDIHEGYPTPATLELTRPLLIRSTGLSPCLVPCSKGLRADFREVIVSPNTTLPVRASVWTASRSLAVTNDIARLLSFPADTKMFQFSAFPIARGNCGGDSHSEILCSFPPCGSHRLIAAWHVLHQLSSRAIHQLAQ